MDSSGEDFDSDQEPEYLSDEEEMEFLDHHPKITAGAQAKLSVWGVIDKSMLAQVQVLLEGRQLLFILCPATLSHIVCCTG